LQGDEWIDDHSCSYLLQLNINIFFQGDISIAKELMLAAKRIGANCVKFQKSSLEDKFTEAALNRVYDSQHSFGKTYGDHKRHLVSTPEYWRDHF
jgi:sialic acid synthase